MRRQWLALKAWLLYRLDRSVAWSPLRQLAGLLILTSALVASWAWLGSATGVLESDAFWWSLARFFDGGTMAGDVGWARRLLAVGITASGILVVSLTIGAIASKLGERIADLRLGQSPVVEVGHLLVLGFDPKVALIARELARSRRRLTLVVLAHEEKRRQEAALRDTARLPGSHLQLLTRTGDPRSEAALLRVRADRAGVILVVPPPDLDDEAALRFTTSTLLALRRVIGPVCKTKVVIECRRAHHAELLALVAAPGLVGEGALPIELVAADDIVARILAQSVRHGAVHLALRELLSFAGSELYLELPPPGFFGLTFGEAHARIEGGILIGLRRGDHRYQLAPPDGEVLRVDDRLVILQEEQGHFRAEGSLPPPPPVDRLQISDHALPETISVLGFNRTLGRLVEELDRVLPVGSTIKLGCPILRPEEESLLSQASARCQRARVDRHVEQAGALGLPGDPALAEADGVILLGCEDEQDPDGDASAVTLLLQLRQRWRGGDPRPVRRVVTEVRDPILGQQIVSTLDDFLVSTDVVAMMLAQAAVDPEIVPAYRELLDMTGCGVFVRPRRYYVPDGQATFAEVMSAARRRGDLAIGFCPGVPRDRSTSLRERWELGQTEQEDDLVTLDPSRTTPLPEGPEVQVVVLARPEWSGV
ncbi:MAG: hypothetical protein IPG45_26185 [Deltaproteobacteria bacterium]|nr:hypothetical protein [Deltaproteobacteria bacterium]